MGAVYTVREAAAQLRCSQSAIYNLVNAGRLRVYRIGKSGVRITEEAIEEFKNGGAE